MAIATTGTGLDQVVNIILNDQGLERLESYADRLEAAKAADGMNKIIIQAVKATGAANDGKIDMSDIRAISQWFEKNSSVAEDFAELYGEQRYGRETGFQLVLDDGNMTRLEGMNGIDFVAAGFYRMAFGIGGRNDKQLLDERGNASTYISTVAEYLDKVFTSADFASMRNTSVQTDVNGSTGTSLDDIVDIIMDDPKLVENVSLTDRVEAANAADGMNKIIKAGLIATGAANDSTIDVADIRALAGWITGDASRKKAFADFYGTSVNGVETGYQLVEGESATTKIGGLNAIDYVVRGLYQVGFGVSSSDGLRLLDETGRTDQYISTIAATLDDMLTSADMRALTNDAVDHDYAGTTGTGLDAIVDIIMNDSGLKSHITASDIAEGAAAADAMNHIIVDAMKAVGATNDGKIDSLDIYRMNDWIRSDAGRLAEFVALHGDDERGSETGYHKIVNDGANTKMGVMNVVNDVADGIYHISNENNGYRFEDEDGNLDVHVRTVRDWLNDFMTDSDMDELAGMIKTGGTGRDFITGSSQGDVLDGGAGNDVVNGGDGGDILLSMGWGGRPGAWLHRGRGDTGDLVDDTDMLTGGDGADRFIFRWLIDGKDHIIDRNRDSNGNVDYTMSGVAGENSNVHDHWVQSMGTKIVTDFDASEGDTLEFEGHVIFLDNAKHTDFDGDGNTDTVLSFRTWTRFQNAHSGDWVGEVVVLDEIIQASDIELQRYVYYGVEDPYTAHASTNGMLM